DLSIAVALDIGADRKPMDEQRFGGITPAKLAEQLVTRPPVFVARIGDQLGQYASNFRGQPHLLGVQLVRLDEVCSSSAHHTEAVQELFEVVVTQTGFTT